MDIKGNTLIVTKGTHFSPRMFTTQGCPVNDVRVINLEDCNWAEKIRGWRFTKIVLLCSPSDEESSEILSKQFPDK